MIKKISLSVALVVLASSSAYADKLCPGLTGKDRTRCLKEEQVKAQLESAKANEQYERAKSLHESACKIDKGARQVAGAVGGAKGGTVGKEGAKLSYDAGRAVGSALAGPDGCPK
jgi:hypothetical protein